MEGGNDHEIYEDARTVGHACVNPEECIAQLYETFGLEWEFEDRNENKPTDMEGIEHIRISSYFPTVLYFNHSKLN